MMETDLFNEVATYYSDIELFKRLGLKTFKFNDRKQHKVGKVKVGDSIVDIWVTGLPAQFWRFKVFCSESHETYKIYTGSGGLHNYWNAINLIAENMIVIKIA